MKAYKLLTVGLLFGIGCGGVSGTDSPTTTGGGSSGVTLSTTVQDSTSASASISAGASLGKSVGKGVAKGESAPVIRVAKATSDATVNNASCSCTDLAGKVLATDKSDGSGKAEMTIPAGEKQVVIKCTLPDGGEVTNLVDVEGKKAGETVSVGTTGPEQDFIFKQILKEAAFDYTTLASKSAAGTLNPIAMYKTIKEMLNETGVTAGSDSVGAAMKLVLNGWRESFANNKPPDFFKNALNNDSSALSTMSGFVGGGLDLTTAMKDHLSSFIPACAKMFDATTYAKMEAAAGGYDAIAKSFVTYKKVDMDSIAKYPENFRGLCQNSADNLVAGDANAFNFFTNSNGAALISSIVGNDPSVFAGDYKAMQKLLQNYKYSVLGTGDIATHGAAITNYFIATDNPAERATVLLDPNSIGETLFNKPQVYAASDGATVAQHIYTVQGNTGGSTGDFTPFVPCSTSYPCAAGSTCNDQHQCVPSAGSAGACTSNCFIGTACLSAICGTGLSCLSGLCAVASGTTQKFGGETCTTTAECLPPLSCKLHDKLRCSY